MPTVEKFLEPDEEVLDTIHITSGDADQTSFDYTLYPIAKPGRKNDDRVLLDIATQSKELVLVGGNPLELEVLHGIGKVSLIDVSTGESTSTELTPGSSLSIKPGTSYHYENANPEEPFIIRDTSPDFEFSNEPNLQKFIEALGATMAGQIARKPE